MQSALNELMNDFFPSNFQETNEIRARNINEKSFAEKASSSNINFNEFQFLKNYETFNQKISDFFACFDFSHFVLDEKCLNFRQETLVKFKDSSFGKSH